MKSNNGREGEINPRKMKNKWNVYGPGLSNEYISQLDLEKVHICILYTDASTKTSPSPTGTS